MRSWLSVGVVLLATGMVLAGCMSNAEIKSSYLAQRPPTADERAQILAGIRDSFVDPHSIEDAEISNVVQDSTGRHAACVYLNARNRLGGYTGKQFSKAGFDPSGHMTEILGENDSPIVEFVCSKERMRYQPFPELNGVAS